MVFLPLRLLPGRYPKWCVNSPANAFSTTRFFRSANKPFSPRIASRLLPYFSSSASINSSPLVSFFSLVIFLSFQVLTHTQTFGQARTLADAAARTALVKNQPLPLVEELSASKGKFRTLLAGAFENSGVGELTRAKLRTILETLVSQSLNTPKSSAIVASVSEHEVYSELAGLLSAELHGIAQSGTPPDEPLVLNYALLIYHLRRWRIPFARLETVISELGQGPLGLRGHLISIQNQHRPESNIDDLLLPIVPFFPATFGSTLKARSDIFGVVESESQCIPAGAGFLHRAMPISNPVDPALLAKTPIATQAMVEEGRRLIYPQFEHTALLFMSLAGIEFLLRSFCPVSCVVDEVPKKLIASYPDLPDALRERLSKIFATDEWNLRNRCMHGSFFEIEGRREDLIRASGMLQNHGVPTLDLSCDGSLPPNVSAVALQALREFANHLDATSMPFSTNWTQRFLLSSEELTEAGQVYCDILQSAEAAEAGRIHVRDYVREVAPSISTALQWGIMAWVARGVVNDAVPGFYFLNLLFEPLLRLTLHLAGISILQCSLSKDKDGQLCRIQYSMLDSRGLLSPANVAFLTNHLNAAEKAVAERVLQLAMKCRNAVAHGAISQFTDEIRTTYGHILIKAIQLVVEAGVLHRHSNPANAES